MSDWRDHLVVDDDGLTRIFRETKTIAVLGARTTPEAAGHYVPAYLRSHGYRILPVNPRLVGESVFGEPVVATLADLPGADVVEVFRRTGFLSGHADEILALPWRPAVVWFQLGLRHDGAAERLARAGIRVVQDRCMMPDHRRLIGG